MQIALWVIWVLMAVLVVATLWLGLCRALRPMIEKRRAKKFLRAYDALERSGVLDDPTGR